jgi:hypothetical protein
MEDFDGAKDDAKQAMTLQLDYGTTSTSPGLFESILGAFEWLGNTLIEYMGFQLDTLQAMHQHEELVSSLHSKVQEKVEACDIEGALVIYDCVNVQLLRRYARTFFLQESGVLQRLAGNLKGALEDLEVSMELLGDDYDCFKHRAYVKYLLGDLEGARLDARRCLQMELPDYYPKPSHLGGATVSFLEYNLE